MTEYILTDNEARLIREYGKQLQQLDAAKAQVQAESQGAMRAIAVSAGLIDAGARGVNLDITESPEGMMTARIKDDKEKT